MASSAEIRWVPLESNPEVMTKYTRALGAKTGEWVDVFALDDDSLQVIPQPVKAVVLLFPITDGYDDYCKQRDEEIKKKGQDVPKDLFFMKQYIRNACGSIGVIHALSNNVDEVKLEDGILRQFLDATKEMDPPSRGKELEKFSKIATIHEEVAAEGQTIGNREDKLVTHFVTFVCKDGNLYELDGRNEFPVNHGPTTAENLLKDAAVVCKARIEQDPTEYRFTVVALTTGETA